MSIISIYLIAYAAAIIVSKFNHDLSTLEAILGIVTGILGVIGVGLHEISTNNKITDLECDIETLKEMIEIDKQRKTDRTADRNKR